MAIKAIIMDLGGTLAGVGGGKHRETATKLSETKQEDAVFDAIVRLSEGKAIAFSKQAFADAWRSAKANWSQTKNSEVWSGGVAATSEDLLKAALESLGYAKEELTSEFLGKAVSVLNDVEVQSRQIFPESHSVLSALKQKYRLAMVTNAANSALQWRLIREFDLEKYFEKIVISTEVGFRKPDSRIFQLILDHWQGAIRPEEVVCVGDSLNRDIMGAHWSGMQAIWLTYAPDNPESNTKFQGTIIPEATIGNLNELPEAIESLSSRAIAPFKPFTVACVFNPKKTREIEKSRCFAFDYRNDVKFIMLDVLKENAFENLEADCLLVKLTDYQVDDSELAKSILKRLQTYVHAHPDILFIEPLEKVSKVLDRWVLASLLQEANIVTSTGASLSCPLSTIYDTSQPSPLSLRFPIICKTLPACGSQSTHHMYLLSHDNQLSLLPPGKWLLQEYVNHGEVVYKVYVLGHKTIIVKKPSLPDLSSNSPALSLDSQSMQLSAVDGSPLDPSPAKKQKTEAKSNGHDDIPPSLRNGCAEISERLGKLLDLNLFGYDIICPSDPTDLRYCVVDVNYFPSYTGVASFPADLLDLILAKHKEKAVH